MLRLGFLPSDFNPMLLILGEAEDFRRLAAVLVRFAADAAPLRLDTLPGAFAATCVALVPPENLPITALGLAALAAPETGFAWRLDPATALDFAARADRLARPDRLAGSDFLTCGEADALPVKLSRGEYTDDFLLPSGLR
ncbi:MAG: hypothetical protein ACREFY_14205 [Acetobacteraceae bacterium]